MRNQKHGHVMLLRQGLQQIQNLVAACRIQATRRFVGKNQTGAVDKSTGKSDPLTFPSTERIGQMRGALRQTDRFE